MIVYKPTRYKSIVQMTEETWVDHKKNTVTNTHEDEESWE
jgi:hypothetical protein